jgi:hypothetical protein
MSLTDTKRGLTVTVRLSPSLGETTPQVETSSEEPKDALDATKAQLKEKQVVLDKLGKLGVGLNMLQIAGEALGDVCSLIAISQRLLTCQDRSIRLSV